MNLSYKDNNNDVKHIHRHFRDTIVIAKLNIQMEGKSSLLILSEKGRDGLCFGYLTPGKSIRYYEPC